MNIGRPYEILQRLEPLLLGLCAFLVLILEIDKDSFIYGYFDLLAFNVNQKIPLLTSNNSSFVDSDFNHRSSAKMKHHPAFVKQHSAEAAVNVPC